MATFVDTERAIDRAGAETALPARAVEERRRRWAERLLLALVLVPLLVAAVQLVVVVGDDYQPFSDWALLELKTRDVGHHPVLTGLYSRETWSHPGPAEFYALAIPYRLAGERAIGLPLGALLLNGAAIAGMAQIARRRGGIPLMALVALGLAVLVRSLGPEFLRDPWNPFIVVLPFGVLVLLVWEMTCASAWALPVSVGVASFCAQTHVGYVLIAVPLVALGAGWLAATAWRHRSRRRALCIAAGTSVAVIVVMWAPPVIDELLHSPGNLSKTIEWFGDAREGIHDLGDGIRVVIDQFGLVPSWWSGHVAVQPIVGEPRALESARIPLLLVPFVASVAVFVRLRNRTALRLVGILALALVIGAISVTRTIGFVYEYRLRWLWVVAMLAAVASAWAAYLVVSRWRPTPARRALVTLCLLAVGSLCVMSSVDAAASGSPYESEIDPAPHALMRQLEHELTGGRGDVIFEASTSPVSEFYTEGLILSLERDGYATRVTGDRAGRYGEHRVHRRRDAVRARVSVADGKALAALALDPKARLVAYAGTPPMLLREGLCRVDALGNAYRAGRLSFDELLRRMARVPTRAIGVFLGPLPPIDPASLCA